MATENQGKYTLLPAYLVLDTSASMTEDDAFAAAFEFLPRMLAEMNKSAVVADKLRVEVVTFDEAARVVFPLGTRESLAKWLEEKESRPVVPDGNWTKYGVAFEKLREEIEHGVQQIRSESYAGEYFQSYRPVVFFITDGHPNDDSADRNSAFARLTDEGFRFRPNIVCIGVGKATLDDLRSYGAGKYKIESGEYRRGNTNLVLVAKDGVSSAAALGSIIPALLASVIASVRNAPAMTTDADDDGIVDPFGETEANLFGDDEDFEELFELFDTQSSR